ncbi:MAG: NfeD family protein [Solirubrobacterales bacterium]
MDVFVVIALVALGLLLAELTLPTGGALAALGAAGLIASGIVALGSDGDAAEIAGPALITLGILSGISFYFVAGKVLDAHRNTSVRTGTEELVGAVAEARSSIDPEGQVWIEGALWRARLGDGATPARLGDRVKVEAVEGLTLVVHTEPQAAESPKQGGS